MKLSGVEKQHFLCLQKWIPGSAWIPLIEFMLKRKSYLTDEQQEGKAIGNLCYRGVQNCVSNFVPNTILVMSYFSVLAGKHGTDRKPENLPSTQVFDSKKKCSFIIRTGALLEPLSENKQCLIPVFNDLYILSWFHMREHTVCGPTPIGCNKMFPSETPPWVNPGWRLNPLIPRNHMWFRLNELYVNSVGIVTVCNMLSAYSQTTNTGLMKTCRPSWLEHSALSIPWTYTFKSRLMGEASAREFMKLLKQRKHFSIQNMGKLTQANLRIYYKWTVKQSKDSSHQRVTSENKRSNKYNQISELVRQTVDHTSAR